MNNGLLPGTGGRFVSPVVALPAGGSSQVAVFAHGLHVTPAVVQWTLVCRLPDQNYVAGDELDIESGSAAGGTLDWTMWKNGAQLGLNVSSLTITVLPKGGGAGGTITNSKWGVKAVALI